jgi:hypothetical protein
MMLRGWVGIREFICFIKPRIPAAKTAGSNVDMDPVIKSRGFAGVGLLRFHRFKTMLQNMHRFVDLLARHNQRWA